MERIGLGMLLTVLGELKMMVLADSSQLGVLEGIGIPGLLRDAYKDYFCYTRGGS